MFAAVATPCFTRTSLLRDRRVVPLFALPRCLTNWQSTGSAWGIILVGVSWRTWRRVLLVVLVCMYVRQGSARIAQSLLLRREK